jgi:transcriptional regulator with XRE-family HTH domain
MRLAEILGHNVRQARLRAGMSQEGLALEVNMKRSYISDMERGIRNPSIKAIERLALALAVLPQSLLELPENIVWPPES